MLFRRIAGGYETLIEHVAGNLQDHYYANLLRSCAGSSGPSGPFAHMLRPPLGGNSAPKLRPPLGGNSTLGAMTSGWKDRLTWAFGMDAVTAEGKTQVWFDIC